MTVLALTLGAAAVLRLNRLVMTDTITAPVRRWLAEKPSLRVAAFFTELLSCVWCTSIWTGAAVAGALVGFGLVDLGPWFVVWPLLTLTYSLVSGWIASTAAAIEAYDSYPGER